MFAGGSDDGAHGSMEIRVIELGYDAHAGGEIEVADPENIDAWSSGDGIGVGKALKGFDLADDGGVAVGEIEVFRRMGRDVVVVSMTEAQPAMSEGRVLGRVDDIGGLFWSFDVSDHHAESAGIEDAGEEVVLAFGDANERSEGAAVGPGEEVGDGVEIVAGVFHVVDDEVEAGGIEDAGDATGGKFPDHMAYGHAAFRDDLLQTIGFHELEVH